MTDMELLRRLAEDIYVTLDIDVFDELRLLEATIESLSLSVEDSTIVLNKFKRLQYRFENLLNKATQD